jgi:hypothetical protein
MTATGDNLLLNSLLSVNPVLNLMQLTESFITMNQRKRNVGIKLSLYLNRLLKSIVVLVGKCHLFFFQNAEGNQSLHHFVVTSLLRGEISGLLFSV